MKKEAGLAVSRNIHLLHGNRNIFTKKVVRRLRKLSIRCRNNKFLTVNILIKLKARSIPDFGLVVYLFAPI